MMRMASETAMAEPARQVETPRQPSLAEPTTARALWPTFMRRTLAEDMVRPRAAQAAE
jgi:hypothetical protein